MYQNGNLSSGLNRGNTVYRNVVVVPWNSQFKTKMWTKIYITEVTILENIWLASIKQPAIFCMCKFSHYDSGNFLFAEAREERPKVPTQTPLSAVTTRTENALYRPDSPAILPLYSGL